MNKSDILILDGDHKNSLAIVRHLGRTGNYRQDIVAHNKQSIALFSKYVNQKFLLPSPKKDPEAFYIQLLELLKRNRYKALLPVSFKTFQICSLHREEIRQYTHLTITTSENILLASSKIHTYNLEQELKIPIPETIVLNHPEEIESVHITYPCVIKAPEEMGANVVEYAHDRKEMIEKYHKLCERYDFSETWPVVQQDIQGKGYGFFAYYEKGVCKDFFMHKRLREYPISGGASTLAESHSDKKLMQHGKKILDYLRWEGIAMVEFKQDERTGIFYLMEINAKFWGSLDLALVCGVNFPQMMIEGMEEKRVYEKSFPQGKRFQWILNGDLFHLLERPRIIGSFFKEIFRTKSDFWIRDPFPNLYQLAYIPVHYYKKWKKK